MERRSISQILDAPEGQLLAQLPNRTFHIANANTSSASRHAGVRQLPTQHHRPPRHDASRQMNAAANFPANEFMAVGGAAYPIRKSSHGCTRWQNCSAFSASTQLSGTMVAWTVQPGRWKQERKEFLSMMNWCLRDARNQDIRHAALVDWSKSEKASGRALSLKIPAVQLAFFT